MIDDRTETAMDPAVPPLPGLAAAAPGECHACGAALAEDQRYCLGCGVRQGEPRVAYRELIDPEASAQPGRPLSAAAGAEPLSPLAPAAGAQRGSPLARGAGAQPGPPFAPAAGAPAARDWTPVIALGGLAALALVLVVGVLIGRSGSDAPPQAAAPQVIRLQESAPAAAAPAANAAATEVVENWPAGERGFTVSLGTLPKDGTTSAQVDAAKADATAKGATGVGVLDSDAHGSLAPGEWVVYAGVFKTRAQAARALAGVRAGHPDARVIEVADSAEGSDSSSDAAPSRAAPAAVRDLDNSSGEDYQRKSRNLPDTLALPGKPPPKDDAAPGGGGEAETIG